MPDKNVHFYMPVLKAIDTTDSGDWIIEGIASTPGIDFYDDVVLPANFLNTLDFFKNNGQIFYNHNYARKSIDAGGTVPMKAQLPIGRAIDAELRPDGLYIKAILNKTHELAQDLWHNHLNNADERFRAIGLSIGANPRGKTERRYSTEHGKYVNYLPELILYEVSVTPTPVNPETWVRVLKGLAEEGELAESNSDGNNDVEIVNVTPDEVIYDSVRNLLIVKSTIENDEGKKFVLEQTIHPTEGILKAMEEKDKKPTPEGQPQDAPKPEGEAGGNPFEAKPEAGAEGANPADAAAGGDPMVDPAAGGEAGAEGGMADMMGGGDAAAGAEGGLDDLFGGEGGEPTDPTADEGGDSAVNSMILDKLDTIVDALTTLVQDMAATKNTSTVGVDSTDQAPVAPASDIMKSMSDEIKVDLSSFIKENLTTVIKSIVTEELTRLVDERLSDSVIQTSVLKSISNNPATREVVIIQQPGVELASVRGDNNQPVVLKSFDGKEIDPSVLKSLTTRYNSIVGQGPGVSQQRGAILNTAEDTLGISEAEFRYYAKKDKS